MDGREGKLEKISILLFRLGFASTQVLSFPRGAFGQGCLLQAWCCGWGGSWSTVYAVASSSSMVRPVSSGIGVWIDKGAGKYSSPFLCILTPLPIYPRVVCLVG